MFTANGTHPLLLLTVKEGVGISCTQIILMMVSELQIDPELEVFLAINLTAYLPGCVKLTERF